jgi:arabinofuranosyltransferase
VNDSDYTLNSAYAEYLGIAVVILAFVAAALFCSFLCDDAFITFRYAKNLADGHGPVYNIGERVEGYTNFLWLLVMSLVIRLGGAPEVWSRVLSIICSVGTVSILWIRSGRAQERNWPRLVFPAFLAFSAPFVIWSTGGLETSAVTFLVLAAAVALLKASEEDSARSAAIAGTLISLAILTRPDSAAIAVLGGLYLVLRVIRSRMRLAALAAYIMPALAIVGTHLLWRLHYYGKLLPNTFSIKSPDLNYLPYGLRYLTHSAVESALWFPLVVVAYVALRNRRLKFSATIAFLLSVVVAFVAWVVYAGGDFMAMGRFLVPVLPVIYLMFQEMSLSSWPAGRSASAVATVILAIHMAYSAYMIRDTLKIAYPSQLESVGLLSDYRDKWTATALLLKRVAQPTDTIMTSAAGIIPYYSGLHTIDALGLTAPDLDDYHARPNVGRPGHSRSLKPEALAKTLPQFLIGHPTLARADSAHFNFSTFADAKRVVVENYYPVGMSLGNGSPLFLYFFLRKDIIGRYEGTIDIYQFVPSPSGN